MPITPKHSSFAAMSLLAVDSLAGIGAIIVIAMTTVNTAIVDEKIKFASRNFLS